MTTAKKYIVAIVLCFSMVIMPTQKSHAIYWVVIREAIKKIIIAIDLQVQRLQNKTIGLQNVQKELENKLSQLKLDEISDWTNKQKEIYKKYFDELWKVKSLIAYYKRITEIIEKQKQLVAAYKKAYAMVQQDKHFSPDEIKYMYSVYSGIINQSVQSIDLILTLVQSFTVQMTDAERLELLNKSAVDIEQQIDDLRTFTNQNMQLSLQRAKDINDVNVIKKLYGLDQ